MTSQSQLQQLRETGVATTTTILSPEADPSSQDDPQQLEITRLQQELRDCTNTLQTVRADLQQWQQLVNQHTAEYDTTCNRIRETLGRVNEVDEELQNAQAAYGATMEEIERLCSSLPPLEEWLNAYETMRGEAVKQLEEVEAEGRHVGWVCLWGGEFVCGSCGGLWRRCGVWWILLVGVCFVHAYVQLCIIHTMVYGHMHKHVQKHNCANIPPPTPNTPAPPPPQEYSEEAWEACLSPILSAFPQLQQCVDDLEQLEEDAAPVLRGLEERVETSQRRAGMSVRQMKVCVFWRVFGVCMCVCVGVFWWVMVCVHVCVCVGVFLCVFLWMCLSERVDAGVWQIMGNVCCVIVVVCAWLWYNTAYIQAQHHACAHTMHPIHTPPHTHIQCTPPPSHCSYTQAELQKLEEQISTMKQETAAASATLKHLRRGYTTRWTTFEQTRREMAQDVSHKFSMYAAVAVTMVLLL